MFQTLSFPFIFVPVARRNNHKKGDKNNNMKTAAANTPYGHYFKIKEIAYESG